MPVTAHRFLPLFLVVATIASGIAQQARETPQLAGRVTRSDTGAPIAGATIYVDPPFFEGAVFNFPTTTTDVNGNYSFTTIRGQSVVSATADGFTFVNYNRDGTPAGGIQNFDAATHLSGIDFKLSPEAVIRGSVITDDGHPVAAEVPVAAYKKPQTPGGKTFATRTYTEANGSFTLRKLTAGTYIVVVNGPNEPLGYPTKGVSYRQKWYGNQSTEENATEIALKEGDEHDGVEIVVEPQTLYTVTVWPAGSDGRQAEGDYYWVSIEGRNTSAYGNRNGSTTFPNIPAGHYTLKTDVRLGGMGGKRLGTQETSFDVTNEDVTLHVTVDKQSTESGH
jgi:hypothetical protein